MNDTDDIPSDLPFSSGTTGKGKGVALSARNVTGCSLQLNQTKGLFDQRETVMGVLPLYHICKLLNRDELPSSPMLTESLVHRRSRCLASPGFIQRRNPCPLAQVRSHPILRGRSAIQSHHRTRGSSHCARPRSPPVSAEIRSLIDSPLAQWCGSALGDPAS